MTDPIPEAIRVTRNALQKHSDAHWIIGFSGGKDSTAILKIFFAAAKAANPCPRQIDIVYCDTRVENPILDDYVKRLFRKLKAEFELNVAPFKIKVLSAPIKERFFVKLIGRGYPPPTNSFRWCTKNLRIRPVSNYILKATRGNAIVSLGLRLNESRQRNRSINDHGAGVWQTQEEAGHRYRIFLPILEFELYEVWDAIFSLEEPASIDAQELADLYKGASGECPIIKSPHAPPCASGRFGCWTCTVVRKDRSSESLVQSGHRELIPYMEFRSWLSDIRNEATRRWPRRRNGRESPGPFTLKCRKEIFDRLKALERTTGRLLLPAAEEREIRRLWKIDLEVDEALMR